MQLLFIDWVDRDRRTPKWRDRVQLLRDRVNPVLQTPAVGRTAYDSLVQQFCEQERGVKVADCAAALAPEAIRDRFGSDRSQIQRQPGEVFIRRGWPFFGTRRPKVARYLRYSGGDAGLTVVSQFAANVSEDEAYVVTSLVRGLVGRGIFSADQAVVVARSGDPDPTKREAIEGDKANALRAINNGGTLVARYTMPMYAAAGATASRAIGLSLSAGVIGPITQSESGGVRQQRNGVVSGSLEGLSSFPVRGLTGTSEVLADFIVGARTGYTLSGGPLRASGGDQGVWFGQAVLGLRQNGDLSVSAVVTFANNQFNDLVPRIGLNLAARR